MSDLADSATDDSSDMDHLKMSRRCARHLDPGALPARDKQLVLDVLAAAAALTVTSLASGR